MLPRSSVQLSDFRAQDIAKLLESAGLAIQALAGNGRNTEVDADPARSSSIEEQRSTFSAATNDYFGRLSSIDTRLRKQIYALEDAEIVPAEASVRSAATSQTVSAGITALKGGPNKASTADKPKNVGATLGNLDVGWLNSRNDSMKQKMKTDLWKAAQAHLIRYEYEEAKAGVEANQSRQATT